MTTPATADLDTAPGVDFRVITPSTDMLNPLPRALHFISDGALVVECPDPVAPINVWEGLDLPMRPVRILPGTTATVLAIY